MDWCRHNFNKKSLLVNDLCHLHNKVIFSLSNTILHKSISCYQLPMNAIFLKKDIKLLGQEFATSICAKSLYAQAALHFNLVFKVLEFLQFFWFCFLIFWVRVLHWVGHLIILSWFLFSKFWNLGLKRRGLNFKRR